MGPTSDKSNGERYPARADDPHSKMDEHRHRRDLAIREITKLIRARGVIRQGVKRSEG